jgi:hypothetical protein
MRSLVLRGLIVTAASMLVACDVGAQQRSTGRSIHMTAVEFKGATTIDEVAAPTVNPTLMSRGYTYKALGVADPSDPKKWKVASYQFSPAAVTVQQADAISLSGSIE